MEFNLKNNKYSTEFKNKPKFESISHKLFSNEELKKDYEIWLAKERQKDKQLAILFATYKISPRIKIKKLKISLGLKLLHRQRHTRQFFYGQQTVYVSQVYPKETSKFNVKPLTSS